MKLNFQNCAYNQTVTSSDPTSDGGWHEKEKPLQMHMLCECIENNVFVNYENAFVWKVKEIAEDSGAK